MKMRMVGLAGAALLSALLCISGDANAVTFTPYQISSGLTTNQWFGGSIGQDFNANTGITITSFGVWVPNGISNPLTVSIYDRTTETVVTSYTFSSSPPVLTGNNVLFGAPVNFHLAAGQYSLVGDGFGTVGLYNTQGTGLAGTLDSGSGALTFSGWRYANTADVYPTITFGSSGCCGGDSDFRFAATTFTAAVPEPATWAMMLLGFASVGFVGYRRSRKSAVPASI